VVSPIVNKLEPPSGANDQNYFRFAVRKSVSGSRQRPRNFKIPSKNLTVRNSYENSEESAEKSKVSIEK
jgi:hypothetical protein